jgi:hypothetical protein
MTSTGASLKRMPGGPQQFTIKGRVYHFLGSLEQDIAGEEAKFAQLYILDGHVGGGFFQVVPKTMKKPSPSPNKIASERGMQ